MENEEIIKAENILKDSGANSEAIDEIMRLFSDKENVSLNPIVQAKEKSEDAIKTRLMDEKDWRKRASLAARLISKTLE